MAKKQAATSASYEESSQQTREAEPQEQHGSSGPAKPVHEVRIGKIKALVWANPTETGVRHNVTIRRIFKRDQSSQWEQTDSFGRDDLPVVIEVTRAAWLWIYTHNQPDQHR